MSFNLTRFSVIIAFSILVMSVLLGASTLDHYYSYLLDLSISGHENNVGEIVSDILGNYDIHRNTVFASQETIPPLSNGSSNVTIPSRSNSLEYNARILCGTIVGEGGPLRPGRYNSDINIFNRQNFPVSFFWNTVLSSDLKDKKQIREEQSSNYIILALDPRASISISCDDVKRYLPAYSNRNASNTNFLEGVLTINVELDPSIQGALSSSLARNITGDHSQVFIPPSSNQILEPNANILSVDAIYTVNALEVPSREIILQLIEYSITKPDESGKIPQDMVSEPLSVTVPIRTNETINPDRHVREVLMREYSLSFAESQSLDLSIKNLSLGVGALDDNHAISLQRINAYQPPPEK